MNPEPQRNEQIEPGERSGEANAESKKESQEYVPSGLERLAAWEMMSLPRSVWTDEEKESLHRIATALPEQNLKPLPAMPKKLAIDELSKETLEGLRMLAARESGPLPRIEPPAKKDKDPETKSA